jgi:hypothetical protein
MGVDTQSFRSGLKRFHPAWRRDCSLRVNDFFLRMKRIVVARDTGDCRVYVGPKVMTDVLVGSSRLPGLANGWTIRQRIGPSRFSLRVAHGRVAEISVFFWKASACRTESRPYGRDVNSSARSGSSGNTIIL